MPELPEVETTIRYLRSKVKEKKILKVTKSNKKLRKNLTSEDLLTIENKKIIDVNRIAKYIVFELSSSNYLIIHLGMSGRLKLKDPNQSKEKHDHLVLNLKNFLIILNDPRRFGMAFLIVGINNLNSFFSHYGYDILKEKIKVSNLFNSISKKNTSIKQILLDQRYFVGIGNIYACEILFYSKISPIRLSNSLSYIEFSLLVKCIKKVLILAINNGGSSINDYKAPNGVLGSFQNLFKVYQKDTVKFKGKSYFVKKITQNGRSSFYCPALQI